MFVWLLIFNFSADRDICSITSFFNLLFVMNNFKIKNSVVCFLGNIIIIFTVFVYNETVILRFCDLD